MSYAIQYFNKELAQVTWDDVHAYFQEENQESDKIEYKSYNKSNPKSYDNGLSKIQETVCAMLNSEGGLIIWGAPDGEKNPNGGKVFKGELSPLDVDIEKDRFIRTITDNITPAPAAIRFHQIKKGEHYLYLIEVDKSMYSPHQFDDRYFMRLDGQNKRAPHHYVEALFKKITFPQLVAYITIDELRSLANKHLLKFSINVFNLTEYENEHDLYFGILLPDFAKFQEAEFNIDKQKRFSSPSYLSRSNAKDTVYFGEVFMEHFTLGINIAQLTSNANQFMMHVVFGGRKSPLKKSLYSFVFAPDIGKYELVIHEENVLSDEYNRKLNIDKYEQIEKIIGRKP